MEKPLSFFNWSLKKALDTEPDSFVKARFRIIYTILLFSLLKVMVVAWFTFEAEQWRQLARALIALVVYISILKLMLYQPQKLNVFTHILLILGVILVWTNIFIYAHTVNLLTIQFIFMIILSSFYTQGIRLGILYSVVSILPVLLSLVFHGNTVMYFSTVPEQFASPGFEIIVVLNFMSIVIAHYLFYRAFHANIREKERLNHQLELSAAEARELADARASFLSTMSHELRTPLNSVIGMSELLMADKPEERQKENLNILRFSALELLSLINNVLDFNKMDSGKIELEKIPVHLSQFMQNICASLRLKTTDKKLNFTLDIDKQLQSVYVVTDPTRLSQVIYNLVSNAIKFTDEGSITVKLQCLSTKESRVEVLFTVTDTGVGIHPDKHDTIFEIFSQAESHITRKYGGTGLGLPIVKQILSLFGSTVQLKSTPGKGSVFSFTIGFDTVAAVTNATVKPDNSTEISHLKILIAEDNDVNRLLLKKQMDNLGLQPVIVENGQLACEAYMAQHFDAILMDLHMPVMDGYEATGKIRALPDAAKANGYIIAFTASVTEQEKIAGGGFDDYLHKPVSMADLRNKLAQIAARKQ